MFLLLYLRLALHNINISSKSYAKIKNANFLKIWNIKQKIPKTLTNKETVGEEKKALHFHTVSINFFLIFEEVASYFHFEPNLEVCLIKLSPIEVVSVAALCQNLILASLSQTAFPLGFPIKFLCSCHYSARRILFVWFSFKHGTKAYVFGTSREFMRTHGICSLLELTIWGTTLKSQIKSRQKYNNKYKSEWHNNLVHKESLKDLFCGLRLGKLENSGVGAWGSIQAIFYYNETIIYNKSRWLLRVCAICSPFFQVLHQPHFISSLKQCFQGRDRYFYPIL